MATSTEDRLRQVFVEECIVDDARKIARSATLNDLGVDSANTIALIMAVEDEFGIEIPPEDESELTTFGGILAYVERCT